MPIISKETWEKLSQEEKEKIRKDYQDIIDGIRKTSLTNDEFSGAKYQMELLFGKEQLQPQLTYEDVARKLFEYKQMYWINNKGNVCQGIGIVSIESAINCTSAKQAEKLLAINKLLNVCAWADMRNELSIEISAALREKVEGILTDKEFELIISNDF